MKDAQKQIDNIIMHFDFDRVHKMMAAVGWRYRGEVISKPQIIECALGLLRRASEFEVGRSVQTGGFRAAAIQADENEPCLQLQFIGEYWSSEYYQDEPCSF